MAYGTMWFSLLKLIIMPLWATIFVKILLFEFLLDTFFILKITHILCPKKTNRKATSMLPLLFPFSKRQSFEQQPHHSEVRPRAGSSSSLASDARGTYCISHLKGGVESGMRGLFFTLILKIMILWYKALWSAHVTAQAHVILELARLRTQRPSGVKTLLRLIPLTFLRIPQRSWSCRHPLSSQIDQKGGEPSSDGWISVKMRYCTSCTFLPYSLGFTYR